MRLIVYDFLKFIRDRIRKLIIKKNIVFFSKRKYFQAFNRMPDLDNPSSFNEKTLWIATFYHNPLYTRCADKVLVREYLENKLGKEEADSLICKKYGIWETPEEIDFDSLPKSFVLKSNHASAQVILCSDKSQLNFDKVRKQLNKWLKTNYYYSVGEWQYKNIKPMIICEELLDSNIVDYRIFCFEGKPTYIKVTKHNSNSPGGYDYNMYYTNWDKTEFRMAQSYGDMDIEKPVCLDYMLELAEKLSSDFHFVRVDFFTVKEKVYFAELTFTPNSGREKYTDYNVDIEFGKMFDLPNDQFVQKEI